MPKATRGQLNAHGDQAALAGLRSIATLCMDRLCGLRF
jgi:hypothetical protein